MQMSAIGAEELEDFIKGRIVAVPSNCAEDGGPFFEEPLVGFAAANDALFTDYKKIIGTFHQTPDELFSHEHGGGQSAKTVVSWIMPIAKRVKDSNAAEEHYPSRLWAHTRNFGQKFIDAMTLEVAAWLQQRGAKTVIPMRSELFKSLMDKRVGIASTWSERHGAFVAGLGAFGLSDGFITSKGIAHRISSIVTDAAFLPSERRGEGYQSNCLFYAKSTCGKCIKRCPASAITEDGHDKNLCRRYSYGVVLDNVGEKYGVEVAGCGLCQTAVPCESINPVK